jgi:hypothetical protein
MSDSYQPIYDAVRSRISNGDIGHVAREVMQSAFDISWQKQHLQQEIYAVSYEMQRPSVLMRPVLTIDGNMWCALYGDNLQDGVAGFGPSPAEAMADFDKNWKERRA